LGSDFDGIPLFIQAGGSTTPSMKRFFLEMQPAQFAVRPITWYIGTQTACI